MPTEEAVALALEAASTLPASDRRVVETIFTEQREPRTPDEGRIMCEFSIAYAEAFLARPTPLAAKLVRAFWAMK